ncbi:unnamed protein product [Allacma fusca]|uniref:C2H2-type domain-containing protein n=1 Tax=Allacma fusca TaxID=39272 RepID=A0A8J2PYX7_9HEXA|nr:unnamed protein product [Allacma fusca]
MQRLNNNVQHSGIGAPSDSHLATLHGAPHPATTVTARHQQPPPSNSIEPPLGIITQPLVTQHYSLPLTPTSMGQHSHNQGHLGIPMSGMPPSTESSNNLNMSSYNANSNSNSALGSLHEPPVMGTKSNTTEGKKFTCHLCCRSVKSKQALDMHIRSHTGEKPYSCSECGKKFSQQASLNRHRKGVHLPKTQECYECGRKFGYRDYLVKHIRIHTGERPYVCPKCEKRFRDKTSLNQHSKWHK